ncbi:MAG: hypothetical protein IH944_02200 [Armatimonadetes bacterium]|nr:hypothetical protein [Armatimonadota bacterium]
MISIALIALANVSRSDVVLELFGADAGVRIVRTDGKLHEEYYLGSRETGSLIATSLSHPSALAKEPARSRGIAQSLFFIVRSEGNDILLRGQNVQRTISVPSEGTVFRVDSRLQLGPTPKRISEFMSGYAFLPPGGGRLPAEAFTAFGSAKKAVIPDVMFSAPHAILSRGEFGMAVIPDLTYLARYRPMPSALEIDASGGLAAGAVIAVGYAWTNRADDGTYAIDQRPRSVPGELRLSFDLILTPRSVDPVAFVGDFLWETYGRKRLDLPLPQTAPFQFYSKRAMGFPIFPDETMPNLESGATDAWWTAEIDGVQMRALVSSTGNATLSVDANSVRVAWGVRWWGVNLLQGSWVTMADEMVNLALSAPIGADQAATVFNMTSKSWRQEEWDVDGLAQTGIWLNRIAEDFPDAPRIDEIQRRVELIQEGLRSRRATALSALFMSERLIGIGAGPSVEMARIMTWQLNNAETLESLAEEALQQVVEPSTENFALALALLRSDFGDKELARRLLQRALLRQSVWSVPGAESYDPFGAFMSSTAIAESRQAVFAPTILYAAAGLGDRVLFERGVAAVRANLGLMYFGTNMLNGFTLPGQYRGGRVVSSVFPDFSAGIGDWRGPSTGAGQLIACLADVAAEYGAFYIHSSGWGVGIDGLAAERNGIVSALTRNPRSYQASFIVELVDDLMGVRTPIVTPPPSIGIRSIKVAAHEGQPVVIATPTFVAVGGASDLRGTFTFGDGSVLAAQLLPIGFGAFVDAKLLSSGPVLFEGSYKDTQLAYGPVNVYIDAPSELLAPPPSGWRRTGDLATTTVGGAFLNDQPLLSTADDGFGGQADSLQGTIESRPFLVQADAVQYDLLGSLNTKLYVEIVDVSTDEPLLLAKKVSNSPEAVTWDMTEYRGRIVVFRLVDLTSEGWIGLQNLRTVESSRVARSN